MSSLTNQNQVQTVPKPEISQYEGKNKGDVCLPREDAVKFFNYVYELENEIEDAQQPY